MVRFGSTSSEKPNPVSRKLRAKLWLLLGMLAVVGMLMQHLQKPKTVEQLGRLFQLKQQAASPVGAGETEGRQLEDSLGAEARLPQTPPAESSTNEDKNVDLATTDAVVKETPAQPDSTADLATMLQQVKDNSVFLNAETPAWLALLKRAQQNSPAELATQSVGELAYAQLVAQPNEYRGEVVTLRGTVLREESLKPTVNDLGIESYHRLVMRPAGGGDLPFVIYTLTLPKDLPRGEGIHVDATVEGYFFKNWSFADDRGLSVAPVVVTSGFDWEPSTTPEQRSSDSATPTRFWQGAAVMAVIAILVAVWIAYATRRRPRTSRAADAETLDSLKRLSLKQPHLKLPSDEETTS